MGLWLSRELYARLLCDAGLGERHLFFVAMQMVLLSFSPSYLLTRRGDVHGVAVESDR